MYVESNICYPMYCVLECHSKPINVPTDTNICLYKHQYLHQLVITFWLLCILFLLEVIRHVILTVIVTQINSLLWTLMVHLWSQWQVNNKPLVTLRWSSVRLFSLIDRWVPCPCWLGDSVLVFLVTRYSLLVTRYSLLVRCRIRKIGYHLFTLPLLVIDIHTLDIWHPTFDIGIGMAVKTRF
jgi:hypothetical protein